MLVIGSKQAVEVPSSESTLTRRLRDLRSLASSLKRSRIEPLRACQAIVENKLTNSKVIEFFSGLPEDEKHYWVSSLYACLIPEARRRHLAAYFTPPHLAHYAIKTLVSAGIKPGVHSILDPASGGAAFLVPLAAQIASSARRRGISAENILGTIEKTLAGVEIEPELVALSKFLLRDLLRKEIAEEGRKLKLQITTADALELSLVESSFDAVIGNPPYGRIYRPSKALRERFAQVITDGYVNLYALFIERALRWVRPGGMVCLIVPISFLGGPHFAALRKYILEVARVVSLDPIDKRSDVFLDVLYDVCVLVLEKKSGKPRYSKPTSSLLQIEDAPRKLGHLDIPLFPSERIWALPDGGPNESFFQNGLQTLEDYGYITKAGYFVWNREKDRYRSGYTPRSSEVPLYWAHNIRANITCEPSDGKSQSNHIGLVKIAKGNSAIIRTDAIILQRTSNRRQRRRIVAGVIRQDQVPGKRGFVSENHTVLILPAPGRSQKVSLSVLCRLLNTEAVDARFRRISGTVSVSTKALRALPLPAAEEVSEAFNTSSSDDQTAELAYFRSVNKGKLGTIRDTGSRRGKHGA
jgi:adenine-specific DNA-methyltransferase